MRRVSRAARGRPIAKWLPTARRLGAFAILVVMVTGSIAQIADREGSTRGCAATRSAADLVARPGSDVAWAADESAAGVRPDYAH